MTYLLKLLLLSSVLLVSCDDTNGNNDEDSKDVVAPGIPTNIRVKSGDGFVTLKWENPNDLDIDSFSVYTKSGSSDYSVVSLFETSTLDSAKLTSLINETEYSFKITLTDTSNNESDFSEEIKATPIKSVDTTPPGIATNLTGKSGNKSVTLNWIKPLDNDLKEAVIYVKKSTENTFSPINTSDIETLTLDSVKVLGFENYMEYTFKVRFLDVVNNEGLFSDSVNVIPENYKDDVDFYWANISSGTDLNNTIIKLDSLLHSEFLLSDSIKISKLNDALGWAYFQKGDGTKSDDSYSDSFNYFKKSDEMDSNAGIAILGHLLDEWDLSLEAAKLILSNTTYTHENLISITRFKALLDGAWSAYLLDDFDSVVEFLNDIDSGNTHSASDVSGLFATLKGL